MHIKRKGHIVCNILMTTAFGVFIFILYQAILKFAANIAVEKRTFGSLRIHKYHIDYILMQFALKPF